MQPQGTSHPLKSWIRPASFELQKNYTHSYTGRVLFNSDVIIQLPFVRVIVAGNYTYNLAKILILEHQSPL